MSFEEQLVRSCSPTLADLKSGNLFRFRAGVGGKREVRGWADRLAPKGISIKIMRHDGDYILVYVFRRDRVMAEMGMPGVMEFLASRGYDCDDFDSCTDRLAEKMESENDDFPHEVGLFLGYPLHDVLGFINNCGRDCRFCGCWKVYDNEHQTREQFIRFKECKDAFLKRFVSGVGAEQLTV